MYRTDIVKVASARGSSVHPLGTGAISLIWDDAWYRNLLLASVLVGVMFLMAIAIFLASTRPTVPSTPETGTAPSGSTAFVQSTVEPSSSPVAAWIGLITEA
jgi:ABC-type Co2+ transport system permease subunit